MSKSKVLIVNVVCMKCSCDYKSEITIYDVTKEGNVSVFCPKCNHIQEYHYIADPAEQPSPIPNDSKPVWEMVIEDMKERDQFGRNRYGTPLQLDNGRDFLEDSYYELLDLAVYIRGEIEKRRKK